MTRASSTSSRPPRCSASAPTPAALARAEVLSRPQWPRGFAIGHWAPSPDSGRIGRGGCSSRRHWSSSRSGALVPQLQVSTSRTGLIADDDPQQQRMIRFWEAFGRPDSPLFVVSGGTAQERRGRGRCVAGRARAGGRPAGVACSGGSGRVTSAPSRCCTNPTRCRSSWPPCRPGPTCPRCSRVGWWRGWGRCSARSRPGCRGPRTTARPSKTSPGSNSSRPRPACSTTCSRGATPSPGSRGACRSVSAGSMSVAIS